jgi:hypothetical protein
MPAREDASPGPVYNVSAGLNSQTFSVGKAQRMPINSGTEETPSPAYYDKKEQSTSHAVSIPRANGKEVENGVPAPGWYKPSEKLTKQKAQSYSMGTKCDSGAEEASKTPGPGFYETPRSMELLSKSKSTSESKFTTARRFKEGGLKTPGVGQYNVDYDNPLLSKRITIPKAEPKSSAQIHPGRTSAPSQPRTTR